MASWIRYLAHMERWTVIYVFAELILISHHTKGASCLCLATFSYLYKFSFPMGTSYYEAQTTQRMAKRPRECSFLKGGPCRIGRMVAWSHFQRDRLA